MHLNETPDSLPASAVEVHPTMSTGLPAEGRVAPQARSIRSLQHGDKEQIRTLLVETNVFRSEEIDVAMELCDIVLEKPIRQDYEMYTYVDSGNAVMGFLCIGPTPITKGTFDLYWIAVRPAVQRHGVGKRLLEFGEELVRSKHGRLLVAETSSQPLYLPSRTFYLHNGFTEVAHIHDYYDTGDDLIIYAKYLPLRQPHQSSTSSL
jgi:GNAT superfamily N-acetyltransferase